MSNDRVAYSPLGTEPPRGDRDQEVEGEGEIEEELPFSRPSTNSQYKYRANFFLGYYELRQLRTILYIFAILLAIIFIAQLTSTSHDNDANRLQHHYRHLNHHLQPTSGAVAKTEFGGEQEKEKNSITSSQNSVIHESNGSLSSSNVLLSSDQRPQYDSYLSSVLLEHNSSIHNEPYQEPIDDLHFPTDLIPIDTKSLSHDKTTSQKQNTSTNWWTLGQRVNKYVTITNYIRAMKSFNYNASITLTTQATTEFMYHTLELCRRWDGPISVAVFSPGGEMLVATTLIKYMRQCLPGPLSACIRDKVTWHFVYNKPHGPPSDSIGYPKNHLDSAKYPLFINQNQCPKLAGPDPSDSIKQFELDLRKRNGLHPANYRQQFQLPYPINVLRNTARLAANTKYILASDIELYPSINLVPSFINYVSRHDIRKEFKSDTGKYSFTLPIFEVKSNVSVPKIKQELVKLIHQGDAIFFHKWVCDACQNFPHRLDWLQTDRYGYDRDINSDNDEILIFEATQRNKSRDSWEPIFVGTNEDPLYDDRLTWDGRRDKMAQMYEMCLKGYQLLVLGNAFLVHAPGIKHIDKNDTMKRLKYIRENNAIYDDTMLKLRKQYSGSQYMNEC